LPIYRKEKVRHV